MILIIVILKLFISKALFFKNGLFYHSKNIKELNVNLIKLDH